MLGILTPIQQTFIDQVREKLAEKLFGILTVNGIGNIYNTDKTIEVQVSWACVYELYNDYLDNDGFTAHAPSISYLAQYSYVSGGSEKPFGPSSQIGIYMSSLKCQFSQGKIYTPLILIQPSIVQQNSTGIFYINGTNVNIYRFYYSE